MSDSPERPQPLGGNQMPRFAGPATMMRLPARESAAGLDACFLGVPLDIGTSNRPGARYGPREIRNESVLLRPYNMATRSAPFDSLNVADIGDVPINTFNLADSVRIIEEAYTELLIHDCVPLTLGGDHTIALPILRAIYQKHGPVGMVHVDAHTDTSDAMFGEPVTHGTPFRRAVDEVREQLGSGPVYISFDIDGLDPAYAGGTGTPEIGGLTSIQALEIIRGCQGLDVVGADLVEVAPVYDASGNTALLAANLLFEMLCILPGVKKR
jgi:guanidinobutyrase